MDSTAKAEFIKDSLIKFFKDALTSYRVTFDISLLDPNLGDAFIDKWFVIDFGDMKRAGLSYHVIRVFCCTRQDNEGRKLVQLTDAAFDALTDDSQEDGRRRVQLYDSSSGPEDPGGWVAVSGIKLMVQRIIDGPEISGPDRTKYKILSCELQWVAKA